MMNILSLFDGISACRLAAERAGKSVSKYYTSEIDVFAAKVSLENYPDQIQLGDITRWESWNLNWSEIDLVTGGFPCQSWSLAGNQKGDKDERGKLFWTMLDVMTKVLECNPKAKFLIENVRMRKDFEEYITKHTENHLGVVHKVHINSSLVSAQNRNRIYWTNIKGVGQPKDRNILLKDVLESLKDIPKNMFYGEKSVAYMERGNDKWMQAGSRRADRYTQRREDTKSFTLTANMHKGVPYNYFEEVIVRDKSKTIRVVGGGSVDRHEWDSISDCLFRKLTPLECERLQTFPDNWTSSVSNTQRYKSLGNAWTVDVIAHILRYL